MNDRVKWVEQRIGFSNCFSVNLIGLSGGLAMMWSDDIALEVVNFSNFHIHTSMKELDCGVGCFLTGFYSQPDTACRGDSWQLLAKITTDINRKWCILGDFNEITSQDKKLGGCLRPSRPIEAFRMALELSGLFDVG